MPTKALRSTGIARISRALREETCPVARLMREAAASRRLLQAEHVEMQIRRLPSRDRSDMTQLSVSQRLHRRLKSIETMASELQPTSLVGVAYQLLLVINLTALDDEIDAACGQSPMGAKDRLSEEIDIAQNTAISAYHALQRYISDPDLEIVERPHALKDWKPNQTIGALLSAAATQQSPARS